MIRRRHFLQLAALAALAPGGVVAAEENAFDRALVSAMKRYHVPGLALAAARGGKLVLTRYLGWADENARTSPSSDTVFGIASLSKTITAAAVLRLVDQGKLHLDDAVYSDSAAPRDPRVRAITIRQLLGHTSGLAASDDKSLAEAELKTAPGTAYRYSNVGYRLLGEVLEQHTGQSYEAAVGDLVFEPMGAHLRAPGRATSYAEGEARRYGEDGALLPPALPGPGPWVAAGGWAGSTHDLLSFLAALNSTLLQKESLAQMLSAAPGGDSGPGWHTGLGWDRVGTIGGCFKLGSMPGVHTGMGRHPNGTDWVFLANGGVHEFTREVHLLLVEELAR